jgi:zinc/manganese transport system substrate-binding protein
MRHGLYIMSVILLMIIGAIPSSAGERLKVVTSFSILADITKAIGGEAVDVVSLIEAGADAHLFEPRPNDIKRLSDADIIIMNGLGFEPWLDRFKSSSGRTPLRVMAAEGITPLDFDDHNHAVDSTSDHEIFDPHAWQDVNNVRIYARNITTALSARDPDHRALYNENLARYDEALLKLDQNIRTAIAAIPPARRKLVTTHDAFGYFARAYGIKMIAPLGVAPEAQPSAKDLARIIRQIRAEAIPAIFLETMIDPRLAQQLAAESGAKIGGTLYSDTLSAKNGPAGTYITMMETNIRALTDALAP